MSASRPDKKRAAAERTAAVRIYQYPKCSTCRKALAWLAARGVRVEAIDLVATPPTATAMGSLHRRSGLALGKLFNTSGESYRGGNWKQRLPGLSDAQAYEALAADGKLIKRPIVEAGDTVLVGFDEAAWDAALG